jgi:hypothetical protein
MINRIGFTDLFLFRRAVGVSPGVKMFSSNWVALPIIRLGGTAGLPSSVRRDSFRFFRKIVGVAQPQEDISIELF